MTDPIAVALSRLVEGWRGNVPTAIGPKRSVDSVLDDVFGRTRAPRSTWNTQAGASLTTRTRAVEPAMANELTGVLSELLTTEAADAALLYGVDPNDLIRQTKLRTVSTRLAAIVTNEMERNTMRGAVEAIRVARADGVSAATTLYTLLGTPPSQVQAAYEAFTQQDAVLRTLATTLRHDVVQWGKFVGHSAGAKLTGRAILKRWLTNMDGRERPSHHKLHRTQIGLTATWNDDGVERVVPGGWNCRCDVEYDAAPVAKFNPNHDETGRFASASGGAAVADATRVETIPDTVDVDGRPRPTRNSAGDLLASTEAGIRNFHRWFGDSKAVDTEGRPQVLYHGHRSEGFTEFDPARVGSATDSGFLGHGFYFTTNKKTALSYAKRSDDFPAYEYEFATEDRSPWVTSSGKSSLGEFYLRASAPLMLRPEGMGWEKTTLARGALGLEKHATPQEMTARLAERGQDGVILDYSAAFTTTEREIMVFDPTSIKSARANAGTFDPHDRSITKGDAMPLEPWEISALDAELLTLVGKAEATRDFALISVVERGDGTVRIEWSPYTPENAMSGKYDASQYGSATLARNGTWEGFDIALWQDGTYLRRGDDVFYVGRDVWGEASQQAIRAIVADTSDLQATEKFNANHGPDGRFSNAPSRPVGRNSWTSTSPREKYALALHDIHARIATHRQLAQDHLYREGPEHAAAGKAHTEAARKLQYVADHLQHAMQGKGAFDAATFRGSMITGRKTGALARGLSGLAKLAKLARLGKFNHNHGAGGLFTGPGASSSGSRHGEGPEGHGGARGARNPVPAGGPAGRGSDRGGRGRDAGADAGGSGEGGGRLRVLGSTVRVSASHAPSAALAATLRASGANAPTFHELDAKDPQAAPAFVRAISALKASSPYGAAVHVYEPSDYAAMRLFVTDGGKSGFALKPDGDMVSLFSAGGDGHAALELGIAQGATKLDCFDTVLPHLYAKHGFVETARLPWNDEHAPADWDKTTFNAFNGGQPDVVFMAYAPGSTGPKKTAPYAADYDAAVASQTRLHKFNPNHDALGLFTTGPGTGGAPPASPPAVHGARIENVDAKTRILPPLTARQMEHAATLPALTKWDTAEIKLLREAARRVKQTADIPGREAIQQHAEDQMYGEGATKKERVAHLIMGGPGTGKSTALGDRLLKESGALLIDSDEAKKHLPEFDGGKGAGVVHVESAMVTDRVLARAALAGDNLVNPVVGKTLSGLDSKISDLKAMGYTVHLHLVDLPTEVAVERVLGRMASSGRFVDTDYVVNDVDGKPKVNFDHLRDDPRLDSAHSYDNNVGRGEPPKRTFSRERKAVHKVASGGGPGAGSGRDAGDRAAGRPEAVRGPAAGDPDGADAMSPAVAKYNQNHGADGKFSSGGAGGSGGGGTRLSQGDKQLDNLKAKLRQALSEPGPQAQETRAALVQQIKDRQKTLDAGPAAGTKREYSPASDSKHFDKPHPKAKQLKGAADKLDKRATVHLDQAHAAKAAGQHEKAGHHTKAATSFRVAASHLRMAAQGRTPLDKTKLSPELQGAERHVKAARTKTPSTHT